MCKERAMICRVSNGVSELRTFALSVKELWKLYVLPVSGFRLQNRCPETWQVDIYKTQNTKKIRIKLGENTSIFSRIICQFCFVHNKAQNYENVYWSGGITPCVLNLAVVFFSSFLMVG